MRPPGCGTIEGLWGYDTRDPFGGSVPRPGRAMNATDPPGWHGIDRWPGPDLTRCRRLRRMSQPRCNAAGEVELELRAAQVRLADEIDRLRSLHEGMRALAAEGAPVPASYVACEQRSPPARDEIARLSTEQQAVANALVTPLPPEPVHAHLRHRALPTKTYCANTLDVAALGRHLGVRLALAVAALILYGASLGVTGAIGIIIVVTGIEALIRGRLLPFLAGVVIILLILTGIYIAVTNIRVAIASASS